MKQRLASLEAELELLQGENLTHPELLVQMRSIDKRRDDKIHEENVLFQLQKKTLRIKTVAERGTSHSQFFQEVRDIKDKALESCWGEYFALQKDRRSWGADTSDFTMLYNPSRSAQIRQQTARNLEVSLLAGIAKHKGFPAAPDMKGLSAAEIEHDLSVMGVSRDNSNSNSTRLTFADAQNHCPIHSDRNNPSGRERGRGDSRGAVLGAESVGQPSASCTCPRRVSDSSRHTAGHKRRNTGEADARAKHDSYKRVAVHDRRNFKSTLSFRPRYKQPANPAFIFRPRYKFPPATRGDGITSRHDEGAHRRGERQQIRRSGKDFDLSLLFKSVPSDGGPSGASGNPWKQ